MMSANTQIHKGPKIVFVCLDITLSHYHHYADFIWRHSTYKMLVKYIQSSVCLRLFQFSQLFFYVIYGLWVFGLLISVVRLWEYVSFILYRISLLSSLNRKFEPLAIVSGKIMKQWYVLYELLYSYCHAKTKDNILGMRADSIIIFIAYTKLKKILGNKNFYDRQAKFIFTGLPGDLDS